MQSQHTPSFCKTLYSIWGLALAGSLSFLVHWFPNSSKTKMHCSLKQKMPYHVFFLKFNISCNCVHVFYPACTRCKAQIPASVPYLNQYLWRNPNARGAFKWNRVFVRSSLQIWTCTNEWTTVIRMATIIQLLQKALFVSAVLEEHNFTLMTKWWGSWKDWGTCICAARP